MPLPYLYFAGELGRRAHAAEGQSPLEEDIGTLEWLEPEVAVGSSPFVATPPQQYSCIRKDGRLQWAVQRLLWVGSPSVATPLHYDQSDNIYVQLSGRKRFLLLPPAAARFVYLRPYHDPQQRHARAHFGLATALLGGTAPGMDAPSDYPAWVEGRVEERTLEVILEEGEVLLLPANWLHHVEVRNAPP